MLWEGRCRRARASTSIAVRNLPSTVSPRLARREASRAALRPRALVADAAVPRGTELCGPYRLPCEAAAASSRESYATLLTYLTDDFDGPERPSSHCWASSSNRRLDPRCSFTITTGGAATREPSTAPTLCTGQQGGLAACLQRGGKLTRTPSSPSSPHAYSESRRTACCRTSRWFCAVGCSQS